jgi:beta-glucosidase
MNAQLGQYECTQDFGHTVTVEQGIRNLGVNVSYAAGAVWSDTAPNAAQIDAAIVAANTSDAIVLVLGDSTDTCGEANDRDNLDLPGSQLDLLAAVTTRLPDTPTIVVLINCR